MNDPASMDLGIQAVWGTHESVQKPGVPTMYLGETKTETEGHMCKPCRPNRGRKGM